MIPIKITIDTKEDSHEEIKKVISLLTHLIGETPKTNSRNIFDNPKSIPETSNLFNIFDQTSIKNKKEETPRIIEY